MSFVKLRVGPSDVVLGTVTKTTVKISLGLGAIRALGWSEDDPNVSASLGTGEDAGWLRIGLDEDEGSTPEMVDGRLELSLPRSALPDLATCRSSPLTWRSAEGAIDVRLPTVAAAVGKPKLATVSGRAAPRPEPDDRPEVIGPPALYEQLHRDAWASGIEVHFLSDGNCAVGGRIVSIDDVESAVRRAGEKRSADVARAGAA